MIGRVFGQYRIDALIGHGGMGAVYRATDTKLGRPVAMKVLHPHLAGDPALVERFRNEARIQAKLTHPHIVAVYDFVQEGDVCAIVMEYVEGATFDKLLADHHGPLPVDRIIELFVPLLGALDFAHRQGVIHRDLKPSNLILQQLGGSHAPKIMDFGIARALGDAKRMTATGARMGTLYYMSPEQCRGERDITHLSDVYSIAATIYELCAGRPPFESDSDYELMQAVISQTPRRLRELNPAAPQWLEAALMQAMAKDPAYRFSSAGEFAQALKHTAVTPPPPIYPRPEILTKPLIVSPRPNPPSPPNPVNKTLIAIGVGLAVVLLIVVLVVVLRGKKPEQNEVNATPNSPLAPTTASTSTTEITDFASISASSTKPDSHDRTGSVTYSPWNLVDKRPDTCWEENAPGDGVGEWVRFDFRNEVSLKRIDVLPGYDKFVDDRMQDRWPLNNRLRRARFEFSDGSTRYQDYLDEKRLQELRLDPPIRTRWVRMIIEACYRGRADDTSIGEVRFFQ
jgi:serine/threonine protein kinase